MGKIGAVDPTENLWVKIRSKPRGQGVSTGPTAHRAQAGMAVDAGGRGPTLATHVGPTDTAFARFFREKKGYLLKQSATSPQSVTIY